MRRVRANVLLMQSIGLGFDLRGALEGAYYRGDHFDLLEKRIFLFSIFLFSYFSIYVLF